MDTDPNPELTEAFKIFTNGVVEKAQAVNAACLKMKQKFPESSLEVKPHDTRPGGNGAAIGEYETAMEELKRFIENQNCCREHNRNLNRPVGASEYKHAIRALEVELVHPEVDAGSVAWELLHDSTNNNLLKLENNGEELVATRRTGIKEWMITGVRVRGLISIYPADGNELPNYSSKSSSSRVT